MIIGAIVTMISAVSAADLLCGEATYNCINPKNGKQLVYNKKPVRFCTINDELSQEELLIKLSYYEQCSALGGIVKISDMNK